MSRRERSRRRSAGRPVPAAVAAPAAPARPAPIWAGLSQGALVGVCSAVVLLVVTASTAVHMTVAQDVRDAVVTSACTVTGCSGPAMTLAGWLLAFMPLLYGAALFAWFRRTPVAGQLAWIVAGALLFIAAIQFLPGKGGPELDELLDGRGSPAFASGMQWGMTALGAATFVLILVSIVPRKIRIPAWAVGLALVLCAAGTLLAAMVLALA